MSNGLSCFLILHSGLGIGRRPGWGDFVFYRLLHLFHHPCGVPLHTVDGAPNTWSSPTPTTSRCYSILCEWPIQARFGWYGGC